MSVQTRKNLILLIVFIMILALLSWASYRLLVIPRGEAFDFYTLWYGGRVFWAGGNPYSQETAFAIQDAVFGQTVAVDANQQGFAYPAHALVFFAPLLMLPFPLAASIWTALQLIFIPLILWSLSRGSEWRPAPLMLGGMLLAVFFFRYTLIVYMLGQTTLFVLLMLALTLSFYRSKKDIAAGISLSLALIRPDIGVLCGLFFLFAAWRSGRKNVLVGWGSGFAAMSAVTLLRRPLWPLDFLQGLSAYADYAPVVWPPSLFPPAGWIATAVMLGLIAYSLFRLRWQIVDQPDFGLAMLIPILLFFIPQTGSYGLALALLTLIFTLRLKSGRWWRAMGAGFVVTVPWLIWNLNLTQGTPLTIEHLIVPLLTMLAFTMSLDRKSKERVDG